MPITKENTIKQFFTADECAIMFDGKTAALFKATCGGNFSLFYKYIDESKRKVLNKWLADKLLKYNVWDKWDLPIKNDEKVVHVNPLLDLPNENLNNEETIEDSKSLN